MPFRSRKPFLPIMMKTLDAPREIYESTILCIIKPFYHTYNQVIYDFRLVSKHQLRFFSLSCSYLSTDLCTPNRSPKGG